MSVSVGQMISVFVKKHNLSTGMYKNLLFKVLFYIHVTLDSDLSTGLKNSNNKYSLTVNK